MVTKDNMKMLPHFLFVFNKERSKSILYFSSFAHLIKSANEETYAVRVRNVLR